MEGHSRKIAVLIPCYNEEYAISKVVADFKSALPEATVYVYDNNSTDRTVEIALQAGAIVRHEPRQGKGNVVRRMFREVQADCYLMVDGDGTYDPADAATMAQMVLNEQVDMVVGDRLSTTYFKENKRPFHNMGNRMVRYLINRFWRNDIRDIMSGYRAFSRRFVKLFPVMTQNFEIETEMTIHALDKQFDIRTIPSKYSDREAGESKLNTWKDGVKVLKTILKLFINNKPLMFFTALAAITLLVAIVALIPVFGEYFETGLVPRFPTLFVGCMLIILSFLFLAVGLILKFMNLRHKQLVQLMRNAIK